MKKIYNWILMIFFFGITLYSCDAVAPGDDSWQDGTQPFSFAFMTDLHLNFGENDSYEGFEQAIAKAEGLGVDFIITGGDNVDADAIGDDAGTAHQMYERFKSIVDHSDTDIKVTIGNHDRFWHEEGSAGVHGAGMFMEYFGDTYFDYEFNGVHFIHLNTSEVCEGQYCISTAQQDWLSGLLSAIDNDKPIVLTVHVPFLSFYYPALRGYYTDTDIFRNFKEIWDMFENHNLGLVLQGHMHLYEELNVLDTQFLTGGAISANWWGGPYHGTPEGFVYVEWDGTHFNWEYIDYGWVAR